MDAELGWLIEQVPGLALHFVRAGAFLAVAPALGSETSSRMLRLVLVVSLGSILWWTDGRDVPVPGHALELAVLVGREVLIGLVCGFGLRAMTFVAAVAGEIISHEMGFSMARVMDPETGQQTTAMAQLFEVMAFMLIFQLDLHHQLLRVLQHTYELVPVGAEFDFGPVWERTAATVARSIDAGMQLAIPVFGVMVLLTVMLVVLARAVQNINLMEFSFGLRILLAFVASIYFLAEGAPFLERVFEGVVLDGFGLFVQV